MELLFEQCEHNQSEEPCEECIPKKEREEDFELGIGDRLKEVSIDCKIY
ncbi:MAG: hypothetical protein ACQEWV_24475 [Bacillota bacterium]